MIDPNAPFLRPLWLRLLLVAVPLGLSAVAMSNGALVWAILSGGVGAYLFWALFLQQ